MLFWVGNQLMNRSCCMIQQIEFTLAVFTEPNDAMFRVGDFTMIDDLTIFEPEAPEFARVIVAVDMMAGQFLQSSSVIGQAIGDRRGFRVRMLDRRWQNRRWSSRPFGICRLSSFQNGPTVVATTFNSIE